MIADMESGEPGWLQDLQRAAASLVANQGLATSVVLAVALVLIAVGVYLPRPAIAKVACLVLAIVGGRGASGYSRQALGGILAGGGDRPQLGPAARPAGAGLLAAADRSAPRSRDRGQWTAGRKRKGGVMTPAWLLDIFAAAHARGGGGRARARLVAGPAVAARRGRRPTPTSRTC